MKLAASIVTAFAGLVLIVAAAWHAVDHGFALHDVAAIAFGALLMLVATGYLPAVTRALPKLIAAWKGK